MLYATKVTPPGEGGISIIHLIGRNVSRFILSLFRQKHSFRLRRFVLQPHRLYLGYLYDNNNLLDEIIIHYIPARESFSGLNTIEINSHGGVMPFKKILDCFLKRSVKVLNEKQVIELAMKNKRISPIQKEALESLLHAPTVLAARVFLDQYNGVLSCAFDKIRRRTLGSQSLIKKLFNTASLGLALNYPKRIAIAGRPNTGKSTLFNALVGKERAIVHPLPGTTRDAVEEMIAIKEIPFIITDTAGLARGGVDRTEKMGIKKMKEVLKKADVIIGLFDGSESLTNEDIQAIKLLKQFKHVIWVVNKSDLPSRLSSDSLSEGFLNISALKQEGIDKLRRAILNKAGLKPEKYIAGQPVIFNRRQYKAVESSHVFHEGKIEYDQ